ncbi:hypothetical protein OGM63_24300 [Plectonema radiosum NIES-515]|uniref:Uncharacterized protein n=1 Tax=Plectonema radiosum NIES-515 TaxID=2986073 RepID=A0ABT3B5D8_9CYAN|nr:hypothetical protein [Plectonema radiosum]MCV3216590.1 hypothetical protein [Plectonema radiosum NIES-515]
MTKQCSRKNLIHNSKFDSYQEAVQYVDSLNKQLKYHQIDSIEYLEKPSTNKKDKTIVYQVNASLSEKISAIKIDYQSAGRFGKSNKHFR